MENSGEFEARSLAPKGVREEILNREKREFFKYKVKLPLMAVMIDLFGQYPKAEEEDLNSSLATFLFELLREYKEIEGNPHIKKLATPVWEGTISEVVHDPMYRDRLIWFFWEVFLAFLSGLLDPRIHTRPSRTANWLEPLEIRTIELDIQRLNDLLSKATGTEIRIRLEKEENEP